jgi:hypothetical protein
VSRLSMSRAWPSSWWPRHPRYGMLRRRRTK